MADSNKTLSNKERLELFFSKNNKPIKKEFDAEDEKSYALVRNIPSKMRSKDLRKYFSGYVESDKFDCFHYRHRPEIKADRTDEEKNKSESHCCLVRFINVDDRNEFVSEFHNRVWISTFGHEMVRRCMVEKIKVSNKTSEGSQSHLTVEDLSEMIELKPPTIMPKGNIGTPSEYFLEQISLCKLPSSLIAKLGISRLRRKRKFEAVHFEYETEYTNSQSDPTDEYLKHDCPDNDDVGEPNDDDDQCEEWERHEALHDDVTEQDRTKPKKYEEEQEVVWEKGGPGLVWYMDKNYWDEREKGTDCDLAWADDWDVDYSVYYEGKSAAEMDAKHAVEIMEDEKMRSGKMERSVFTKQATSKACGRKRRKSDSDTPAQDLASGIGGQLLSRMGWSKGHGLGRYKQGKVDPVAIDVEEDGQAGTSRKGIGYRGDVLQRHFAKKPQAHLISSIYDSRIQDHVEHKRTDNPNSDEVLFRRGFGTEIKYRPN